MHQQWTITDHGEDRQTSKANGTFLFSFSLLFFIFSNCYFCSYVFKTSLVYTNSCHDDTISFTLIYINVFLLPEEPARIFTLVPTLPFAGFSLGSTIQSHTNGIWMWCIPHPQKPDNTLILLDTEGLGDVEKVRKEEGILD